VERGAKGSPVTLTGSRRQVYGSSLHYEGPEARLRRMDELGVDVAILSVLPPLYRYELPVDVGLAAARDINDDIADLCRRWPDRFLGLATLPLQDPVAAIEELERARQDLGLIGAAIGTYVRDRNLDDEGLRPVFGAASTRRALLFCHPSHPRGGDVMASYYLRNLIGNTWETSVAMASLLFGGVLEAFPDLAVCFAHGGGFGPYAVGRLEHGYRARPEPRVHAREDPRTAIARVYVDSLTHDDRAMKYLLDTVGPDRVLLGSDFPADMGPTDPVGQIDGSTILGDEEKAAIKGGNAMKLLERLGHAQG
jgi:aminocarboxymuconate-semialdehyde decarboxylase